VVELFIHLIPYLGVPRMVAVMRCAGEVLREHARAAEAR
jgi:alkylhydroperoxidase/carboxymuconolactone decarboxylase family protein YurZ